MCILTNEIMPKFNAAQKDSLYPIGIKHEFSVLALLTEKSGKPCFVFEVRSSRIDRQPGETCFPGGEVEKGEDIKNAALRETREELGIPEESIKDCSYLGTMVQYWGSAVHVFTGMITEETFCSICKNESEVEEIFTVSVERFASEKPDMPVLRMRPSVSDDFPYEKAGISPDYHWGKSETAEPVWNFDGHSVWGLTGRIILFLLDILV